MKHEIEFWGGPQDGRVLTVTEDQLRHGVIAVPVFIGTNLSGDELPDSNTPLYSEVRYINSHMKHDHLAVFKYERTKRP